MQVGRVCDGVVDVNGQTLIIKEFKEGKDHRVYCFEPGMNTPFGDSATIILKTIRPCTNPVKMRQVRQIERKAYDDLKNQGVAVPVLHLATNNGWILEKLNEKIEPEAWKSVQNVEELSEKNKKILAFAKDILTKSALLYNEKKPEAVGDFYPQNVMLNSLGEPCVVDFSRRQKGSWGLYQGIQRWSNGNTAVKDYLMAEFPEKAIAKINAWAMKTTPSLAAQSATVSD